MERQFLNGRYLDLQLLTALLRRLFGANYQAEERNDGVVITVPTILTQAQIESVQIPH